MIVVRRTQIIGTNQLVFRAYETGATYTSHSSVLRDESGQLLGDLTARPLPAHLEALRGEARFVKATEWMESQKDEATAAIFQAFPWLFSCGQVVGGAVHATTDDEAKAAV